MTNDAQRALSAQPRESLKSAYANMKKAEREWQGWLKAADETTEAEIAEARFDEALEHYQDILAEAEESAGFDRNDWGFA
jgi:hypothetical protein